MSQTETPAVLPRDRGLSQLVIRDFLESDLSDLVRINNLYYTDTPTTVDQRDHERRTRPEFLQAREFVGEVAGKVAIVGIYVKAIWFNEPGRGHVHYSVDPAYSGTEIEPEFLQALVEYAVAQGNTRINSALSEKHPHHIRTLENAGFRFALRQPVTAVDPQGFDPAPFQQTTARLVEEGIAIRPLTELGDGWQRRFHEFHAEVVPDIPHTEPVQPMPWDEFEKFVNDPKQYSWEGKYVAMEGDRFVGVSEIQANVADPTIGQTMLTGVLRSHRRRGIASALKAAALRWAKEQGMRRVLTDNEENNPMLQLNKQLGFREIYAYRQYVKDISGRD